MLKIRLFSLSVLYFLIFSSSQVICTTDEENNCSETVAHKRNDVAKEEYVTLQLDVMRFPNFICRTLPNSENSLPYLGHRITELICVDRIMLSLRSPQEKTFKELIGMQGKDKDLYVLKIKPILEQEMQDSIRNEFSVIDITPGINYNSAVDELIISPAELKTIRRDKITFKIS